MTVVNPKSISGINSITTGSGSDDILTIHTNNGTERLRVDSTGATKIVTGIVTTLTATTGIVTTLTASTVTSLGDVDIADKIVHTGDTNTSIRFPAADTITAETGGSERFRIDSGGRVSIGNNPTVHADTIFHIEDSGETNIKIEGSTSTLGARISLQNNDATANSYSQFAFNDAGGQSTSAIQGINTDNDNNYGELAFLTRSAQGSPPAERVRITKDGTVNIGGDYTNTTGSLKVTGTTTIDGNLSVSQKIVHTGDTDTHIEFASNTITFDTNSQERLRIASDGQLTHNYDIASNGDAGLILNTDDASKASSILFRANSESRARIDVQRLAGDGAQLKIQVSQMNNSNTMLDAMTIAPVSSGDTTPDVTLTGNLVLADGAGVDFSAASGSAAGSSSALLDDYEEGSFTPTSNATLTTAYGNYTKIGRQVTLHMRVTIASNSSSNQMNIAGFPFTPNMNANLSNGAQPSGFGYISGSVISGGIQIHSRNDTAETQFYNFGTNMTQADFSGRQLRFGLVYYV